MSAAGASLQPLAFCPAHSGEKSPLPRFSAAARKGAIFLTWDEGDSTSKMPFIAIGAHVKAGYAGAVQYDHSSLLKSIERILEVPILPKVSGANDFSDLFQAGFFP